MLDRKTGEVVEQTLKHQGEEVRAFYAGLPAPVTVGIEATGSMGWFLQLMGELQITCRVGHPATIRKAETRKDETNCHDDDRRLRHRGRVPRTEHRPTAACHTLAPARQHDFEGRLVSGS
jgi:transposase